MSVFSTEGEAIQKLKSISEIVPPGSKCLRGCNSAVAGSFLKTFSQISLIGGTKGAK